MPSISRDQLHRAIEQLPDDRLAVAAELLEALLAQDRQVRAWRNGLSTEDEAAIAASLARQYTADEWIADEDVEQWIAGPESAEQRTTGRSRLADV